MTKNEFTFEIKADEIDKQPAHFRPEMTDDEAEAVSRRLEIKALDMKRMEFKAQRMDDGCTIYINGRLQAEVTQPCVVTLEDVTQTVDEEFEAFYLDESQVKSFEKAKRSKQDPDDWGEDSESEGFIKERRMPEPHEEPEIIKKGKIDAGELIIQSLSLGIDPYPHADGARPDGDILIHEEEKPNPFAALKDHVHKKS